MKFRDALRHWFGGRLHDERLHAFRVYARDSYKSQRMPHPSRFNPGTAELEHLHPAFLMEYSVIGVSDEKAESLADELIATLTKYRLLSPSWFFSQKEEIQNWRKANRIRQRRAANQARWLKRERVRLLTLLVKRKSDISHL